MKEVLHPESQSPDAVKFHFIDVYLDELSKVGGKEVRNSLTPASGAPSSPTGLWPSFRARGSWGGGDKGLERKHSLACRWLSGFGVVSYFYFFLFHKCSAVNRDFFLI